METLPVIFRADRAGPHKGEVTAIFPTLPADGAGNMTCYAHVGQHGACCDEWYTSTRPATEAEAAPLLRELRGIYESDSYGAPVKLEVRKRRTAAHRRALVEGLRR